MPQSFRSKTTDSKQKPALGKSQEPFLQKKICATEFFSLSKKMLEIKNQKAHQMMHENDSYFE